MKTTKSKILMVRQENSKFWVFYDLGEHEKLLTRLYKYSVPNTVLLWMLSGNVEVLKTRLGAIWILKTNA